MEGIRIGDDRDASVLLEVKGEFTVPNVESKEKLAEMLASGKYLLDLGGAELRMSGEVKGEVFEALGLIGMGLDELKTQIVLRGVAYRAPPGSHELVNNFMRKGSRDQHFAVVRELARRRREELEKSAEKPMPPPVRRGSSKLSRSGSSKGIPASREAGTDNAKTPPTETFVTVSQPKEETPVTAGTVQKKDKLTPQHFEELSTFRSATTAADLASARLISDAHAA